MSEMNVSIPIPPTIGANPIPLLQAQFQALGRSESPKREQIRRMAQDFEGVFLQKLMQEMQNTIPESGMFSSAGMRQIQGMFWGHLSQEIARNGGMGLARSLYKDFCRLAGVSATAPAARTERQKRFFDLEPTPQPWMELTR